MNTGLLWGLLVGAGFLFALVPFALFMGVGTVLGIPSDDFRIRTAYVVASTVISYAISLGAFSILQKSNCDRITNFKQISLNGLISVFIQIASVSIITFVPWFKNVIGNLIPPDVDPAIRDSLTFSYYAFWAMAFAVAVGGTLSSSCGTSVITPTDLFGVSNKAVQKAGAPTASLPTLELGD